MGCGCSKPMPGAFRMASNATRAAGRIVAAAVKGDAVLVSPGQMQARLARCKVCAHCVDVVKNGTTYHRCTQCGCWLDAKHGKSKASYATETCPLDYWPEPQTPDPRRQTPS